MSQQPIQLLMREVIQRVAVGPEMGKDISRDQAYQVMQGILQEKIDPVQDAVFLIALRMKRESLEEYHGLFDALQEASASVLCEVEQLLYMADPFDGYVRHLPMSPFLPAVLSACGVHSVMQGVESVGPKHGITAHQVYQLYGIAVDLAPARVAQRIEQVGWGYLDQAQSQPALFAMQTLRDLMVKRTAITTLERMIKPIVPAGDAYLLLGYVHKAYPEIYSQVALQAGFERSVLVKGIEGGITPALNKPVRHFSVTKQAALEKQIDSANHENFSYTGIQVKELDDSTNLVEQTLEAGLSALAGQPGVAYDSLVLAASIALLGLDKHQNKASAAQHVESCLRSGQALAHFKAAI